MGKTVAEKILSYKSGKILSAGDITVCPVDFLMASDATAPIAIKSFTEMGGKDVCRPDDIVFFIDHAVPCPTRKIANLHMLMREFAAKQQIRLFDSGEGICHQLVIEHEMVKPGDLVLGADSHTCTYGAVGAFAVGVGATDLAAAMMTGISWLKVPETMKINLQGSLPQGTYIKDLMLYLVGMFGSDAQNYRSIEFYGEALGKLLLSEKITVCNMVIEMGAKNGIICDSSTGMCSDKDAVFVEQLTINLDKLMPYVALPHKVENVVPVEQAAGIRINQCFLGSCTNGKLDDLRIAADIVRGKHIAPNVRFLITPASRIIMVQAMNEGIIQTLLQAGGMLTTPGCGLCVGTLGGIPGDGENVLSSTNRNFKGRMGNGNANIYLASPATVAASALYGQITDPRMVLK